MFMRMAIALIVLLAPGVAAALAAAPVPRPAPDFAIVESSGKTTSLSSLKGQVVVIEFMLAQCKSCLRTAQTINSVRNDLAPRGLQVVAIAFDKGMNALGANNIKQTLKLDYPIGYTTSDKVDGFLGRAAMERLPVPEIVVIDRSGIVRAQTRHSGDVNLESEKDLRRLLGTLLDEKASAGGNGTASPDKPG